MYVCFKTLCFVVHFAIPTQRKSPNRNDFLNFQKNTVRDTILILVYIHTYPVFARRINIVQRMRVEQYVPCRGNSLSEVST